MRFFQLETDPEIMIAKAKGALETYKHQVGTTGWFFSIRLHALNSYCAIYLHRSRNSNFGMIYWQSNWEPLISACILCRSDLSFWSSLTNHQTNCKGAKPDSITRRLWTNKMKWDDDAHIRIFPSATSHIKNKYKTSAFAYKYFNNTASVTSVSFLNLIFTISLI